MYLKLGNTAPKQSKVEGIADPQNPDHWEAIKGPQVTEVNFPDDVGLNEAFLTVTALTGVWAHHSFKPPSFVTSDSPGLAALLAEHYGCEVKK